MKCLKSVAPALAFCFLVTSQAWAFAFLRPEKKMKVEYVFADGKESVPLKLDRAAVWITALKKTRAEEEGDVGFFYRGKLLLRPAGNIRVLLREYKLVEKAAGQDGRFFIPSRIFKRDAAAAVSQEKLPVAWTGKEAGEILIDFMVLPPDLLVLELVLELEIEENGEKKLWQQKIPLYRKAEKIK